MADSRINTCCVKDIRFLLAGVSAGCSLRGAADGDGANDKPEDRNSEDLIRL